MADQHQISGVNYSVSSADQINSSVVENSMWDEWTHPSNVGDDVSPSNFLADLTTSSSSSPLSFHQTDMLSPWMSTFYPLGLAHSSIAAPEPSADMDPHPSIFMHEAGLAAVLDHPHSSESLATDTTYPRITSICSAHPVSDPTLPTYPAEDESPVAGINGPKASTVSRHLLQALGPQSPSSPLAIQNGMLDPLRDPWDGSSCPSAASAFPSWPIASTQNYSPSGTTHSRTYFPDDTASAIDHLEGGGSARFVSRSRHTDIFIGPNGTFDSTPGGWRPQFYDFTTETTLTKSAMEPMKMMESQREAGESAGGVHRHHLADTENRTSTGSFLSDCRQRDLAVWLGKHRLELSVDGDDHHSALQLKRSKFSADHGNSSAPKWWDPSMKGGEILRTYNYPSGSLASQAMDIIAIGPALNTNGKPRARRGSATDPQSVYARQRRERINDRLKTLQHLVPNGAKVDIVTMLDEAYDYVKFLQYQVTLLKSDEFWMHATPYNYNGMDISNPSAQTQELESSA